MRCKINELPFDLCLSVIGDMDVSGIGGMEVCHNANALMRCKANRIRGNEGYRGFVNLPQCKIPDLM